MDTQETDFDLGGARKYGVICGLIVRDPQSATLATTIEGGKIRYRSTTLGQKYDERVIAEASKTFTASKDTYVLVGTNGTLFYVEVANGAAKPTQTTLEVTAGAYALLIAKVVTDGTRITDGGVTDMRAQAPHGEVVPITFNASFLTADQGARHFPLPFSGRVLAAYGTVTKALGITDVGTVTLAIGKNDKYANVTGGQLSFAAAAALGARGAVFPTALNDFQSGNSLRVTTAKVTTNGEVEVTIWLEKLPK